MTENVIDMQVATRKLSAEKDIEEYLIRAGTDFEGAFREYLGDDPQWGYDAIKGTGWEDVRKGEFVSYLDFLCKNKHKFVKDAGVGL